MLELLEMFQAKELWIGGVISLFLGWSLRQIGKLFRGIAQHIPQAKSAAAEWLKKILLRFLRAYVLRIKAKRFDQVAINREIAKSYAALVIFCIYAAIWMVFVMLQKLDKGSLLIAMIPALIAEAVWITKSAHVDNLIRAAKRLRHNARRVERFLDARERAIGELQKAVLVHHPLVGQGRVEVELDHDTYSGTIWIWALPFNHWDPERCVAGYDFSYAIDPELGKEQFRFEATNKPLLSDRELVRRKPAPQPQT